jgi:hypothetical protein
MHGAGTTGTSRSTGLPCAMGLRLIRALPGDQALLSPLPCVISQGVAPAQGRQDHTISPSAKRHSSHDASRPSHPASNVRDDREAPLMWQRDARMVVLICPTTQRQSPATDWHDGQFLHGMHAEALSTSHSGAARRAEPGISRFRARCFASPRNDDAVGVRQGLSPSLRAQAKQSRISPRRHSGLLRRYRFSQ